MAASSAAAAATAVETVERDIELVIICFCSFI